MKSEACLPQAVVTGVSSQDPNRSWLHYLDGRQALRVGVLLHLGKLSLPPEVVPHSSHGKA